MIDLIILRTVDALRAQIGQWRAENASVALVPTMGALHEGHLSLVRLARSKADRVVASLFVNPAQFAPGEDLEAYPRDEQRDAALLAAAGCDRLYAPDISQIYPTGFATTITVSGVAEPLEGLLRPGHFAGVATVVAKLLIQTTPDVAVFGEKDYQQLQMIRRLTTDLDLPVRILQGPVVREKDGLALSSRNAYLSPSQRAAAPALYRALLEAARQLSQGGRIDVAEAEATAAVFSAGYDAVDYVEVRDAESLVRLGPAALDCPARLLAVARMGHTRLIDNLVVSPAPS
jgi:pantoate--beta-alanine ligase